MVNEEYAVNVPNENEFHDAFWKGGDYAVTFINESCGEEYVEPSEAIAYVVQKLETDVRNEFLAQVIMQCLGDAGERAFKHAALDVAESIGPDHAQTLYHFAKLVTKLA